MSGGKLGSSSASAKPPGATPIEIARASPTSNPIRLVGDPILHPDELVGARYRVDALLGRGGFGDVYRATHIGTHEKVALKVLRPELLADATSVERFTHEARLSAGLRHPNTVHVFDFGRISDDGPLYLAMQYLEGDSLESILCRDGPLEPHRAARVLIQVLKSLGEAHGRKIVHRDLKPENIFVGTMAGEADFVHVIDFGIAKFVAEGASPVLTQAGAIIGTPHYMSPEQIRGLVLDFRADLYSTGVVLFRCLTNNHPFNGDTTFGILAAHLQDELPKIAMPGVDAQLQAIVAKALARDRDERHPTADAFRQALEVWLTSHPERAAAAQFDDRTSMSDVLTPDRLRASHERRIASSSQTVVGSVPSESDALPTDRHERPDTSRTISDVHQPVAIQSEDATRLEIASFNPDQRGANTAVIADAAELLAALPSRPGVQAGSKGRIAPKPAAQAASGRLRSSSAVAVVPAARQSSKPGHLRAVVVAEAAATGNTVGEEGLTVSMDVLSFGLAEDAPLPVAQVAAIETSAPATAGQAVSGSATAGSASAGRQAAMVVAAVLAVTAVGGLAAWYLWPAGEPQSAPTTPASRSPVPAVVADPAPSPAVAASAQVAVAPVAASAVAAAVAATESAVATEPAVALARPSTPSVVPGLDLKANTAVGAPGSNTAEQGAVAEKPAATVDRPARGFDVDKPTKGEAKPARPATEKTAQPAENKLGVKAVKTSGCSAAEGSAAWCTTCPAAVAIGPSSKHYCPCLEARGQTSGLSFYCKCVFPKETHKIGTPAFCRCNPRDAACQQE